MEKEEKEIDLLELGKKLWDNKKFIIKCSIIGAVVGLIIAFSIPKEYTTTVLLTTGTSATSSEGMGALASITGFNLVGVNEDVFSPELYPDVLSSTPFAQGLLDINVSDNKSGINTSLYNYLRDEQKNAWWIHILKIPGALISIFSSDSERDNNNSVNTARYIPKEEMVLITNLINSYSISTDKKTGVITITMVAQSPSISAYLADTLTSYLQTYIIEQRTKKAKTDLYNSEKLYEQSRTNYYKSQQDLAAFVDANMNVISAKYKIHQEKLQNEANTAYSVYNQMAQQVQMNKIKVQDNTPIFTVIQPAVEALYPSGPRKKIILVCSVLISILTSSTWLLRDDIRELLFA